MIIGIRKRVKQFKLKVKRRLKKLEEIERKTSKIPRLKKYPKNFINPKKNIQLEWWYFTGHLHDSKEKEYGFELAFFKFLPTLLKKIGKPLFIFFDNIILAHFAITDIPLQKFEFQEKSVLNRAKDKISFDNLFISLDDWRLKKKENKFFLQAKGKDYSLSLELIPLKPLVMQPDNGYSVKHNKPFQASYYFSFTRLQTEGYLKIKGKKIRVHGTSWFDHEKTYHPKNSSLVGWDWYCIMLDNNTEIMFYKLKTAKGITKKFSIGAFIDKNGKVHKLKYKDIKLKTLSYWKSKRKVLYPASWNMEIPKLKLNLKIIPVLANQEIRTIKTTPAYWEGKCNVFGTRGKKKKSHIDGKAYVELVGYDKSIISRILTKLIF